MQGFNAHNQGGSLQISTGVVEKIVYHAAMEVDGVRSVVPVLSGAQSLLGKLTRVKPIRVEIKNGVADVEVSVTVDYGTKIPDVSTKIQQHVKDTVQSMTSITVARVDVLIAGLEAGTLA